MKHQRIEVPDAAKALFGSTLPGILEANPRRPLREAGEGLDETLYVCTGLLAIYRADNKGHRSVVALRYPNDVILPGGRAPGFSVAAIIHSTVAVSTAPIASTSACLRMTKRNEAIAQVWLARQANGDSTARVAHLLCETAMRSGQGIQRILCPFSQVHMAEITGQTSVNVNRVLGELEQQGLLKRKQRHFTFLNWSELARLGGFRSNYLEQ
jgi:CRP-like cAMP-binding protein